MNKHGRMRMKLIIMAGGQQSTLSNFGEGIPKPMIEVGGKPLLWHIMKHFSKYGINEFFVCGGYRVDMIKDYFRDFYIYDSDFTIDLATNTIEIHKKRTENWKITVVDTGLGASPGQRLNCISDYLKESDDEVFLVTMGDCLSDIDVEKLIQRNEEKKELVTLAMAKPLGRKQLLAIDENDFVDYEKLNPVVEREAWVNADCFVMNKKVLEVIKDNQDLENYVFPQLSKLGQVNAYKHEGFWITVETMRDLMYAENLWNQGNAPWIV